LALLLISLSVIAAVWWSLAKPVTLTRAPIDPTAKLDCVSYAPFRDDQTPSTPGLIVSPEQIQQDLVELARISNCVRTYSVDNGLDKVPELASKVGLTVLLGIWIGNNPRKNAQLIETAISLARNYPGVIKAIIVGNEVLLHGEMTPSDLRKLIRSVKARVNVPVSYADVWEFRHGSCPALLGRRSGQRRRRSRACRCHSEADGHCLSRQGNPDRRDWLAKPGTDA
jgi:exo-beta-1,3-glucanase (GH17 family)